MNHENLILKYFNKTLSKKEETLISNLLETDATFKVLFNEHENMHMAFKLNEKAHLKNRLKQLDPIEVLPIKKTLNKKLISLALACCLAVVAFYFFSNNTMSYHNYFEVYPNVYQPVVRGSESKNNEAFIAYENKNYLKAENDFKAIIKVNNTDANIEFYYAMSLLNQNKFSEAKAVLNKLKNKNHNFKPETLWYAALISINNKDLELAKKELNTLLKLNSDFKKEETKQLLKRLE